MYNQSSRSIKDYYQGTWATCVEGLKILSHFIPWAIPHGRKQDVLGRTGVVTQISGNMATASGKGCAYNRKTVHQATLLLWEEQRPESHSCGRSTVLALPTPGQVVNPSSTPGHPQALIITGWPLGKQECSDLLLVEIYG